MYWPSLDESRSVTRAEWPRSVSSGATLPPRCWPCHALIVWSHPALKSTSPDAPLPHVMALTTPVWPPDSGPSVDHCSASDGPMTPDDVFHTLTMWSEPHDASDSAPRSTKENCSPCTTPRCASTRAAGVNVGTSASMRSPASGGSSASTFHRKMLKSCAPDAISRPSGCSAIVLMRPAWPSKRADTNSCGSARRGGTMALHASCTGAISRESSG
mmetsp:Transcript_2041/g.6584  ORF Transcript_2041/g.6584 Transcript_2041/m.6584 type:complete len:215 (+) Transcript_2041:643-1287(+)